MKKNEIGKVRLKRVETDMLNNVKELTTIRTSLKGYSVSQIRNLASKCDAVSSHLFQIANEIEEAE